MKKKFVSCFDIGEVPRSPGKWNWNWLYFLPFIFTFKQGVKIVKRACHWFFSQVRLFYKNNLGNYPKKEFRNRSKVQIIQFLKNILIDKFKVVFITWYSLFIGMVTKDLQFSYMDQTCDFLSTLPVDGSYLRGRPRDKCLRFKNSLSSTVQKLPKSSSYRTKHLCNDKFVLIAFWKTYKIMFSNRRTLQIVNKN